MKCKKCGIEIDDLTNYQGKCFNCAEKGANGRSDYRDSAPRDADDYLLGMAFMVDDMSYDSRCDDGGGSSDTGGSCSYD